MKRVSGRVPAVRERRQEQQRPVPGRNLIEQPDKRVDRHDGPFLGVLLPGANMEAANPRADADWQESWLGLRAGDGPLSQLAEETGWSHGGTM